MKKINLFFAAAFVTIGFAACNNATDVAKQDAELLTVYVDSVDNLQPVYTVENWTTIDNGYQERAMKAEKSLATLDAAAKEKAEASKAKYAALKARYELELKANETRATVVPIAPNYRQILRNRLFGEGKIGDDMKFEFVTGANVLSVYKNFVDVVSDNKKTYSREDWDEVNVLYEALDSRKNAVEKDLASADNLKIAGLKIRFASIAATHRGGTKVKENSESKQ